MRCVLPFSSARAGTKQAPSASAMEPAPGKVSFESLIGRDLHRFGAGAKAAIFSLGAHGVIITRKAGGPILGLCMSTVEMAIHEQNGQDPFMFPVHQPPEDSVDAVLASLFSKHPDVFKLNRVARAQGTPAPCRDPDQDYKPDRDLKSDLEGLVRAAAESPSFTVVFVLGLGGGAGGAGEVATRETPCSSLAHGKLAAVASTLRTSHHFFLQGSPGGAPFNLRLRRRLLGQPGSDKYYIPKPAEASASSASEAGAENEEATCIAKALGIAAEAEAEARKRRPGSARASATFEYAVLVQERNGSEISPSARLGLVRVKHVYCPFNGAETRPKEWGPAPYKCFEKGRLLQHGGVDRMAIEDEKKIKREVQDFSVSRRAVALVNFDGHADMDITKTKLFANAEHALNNPKEFEYTYFMVSRVCPI